MAIKIHMMPQKSIEWFDARDGLLSASKANAIAANGAGLRTYCKSLARQKLGIIEPDPFYNSDMERGDMLEHIAISAYELETGLNVLQVGGITNDKYVGCWVSPDGLVGDNGGCEVKARNDEKHFDLIQGGTKDIPFDQIQMSLMISEREWWDFISYNPNFKEHPIFIKRIFPDYAYHVKLKKGIDTGLKLIPSYIEAYKNYKFNI